MTGPFQTRRALVTRIVTNPAPKFTGPVADALRKAAEGYTSSAATSKG